MTWAGRVGSAVATASTVYLLAIVAPALPFAERGFLVQSFFLLLAAFGPVLLAAILAWRTARRVAALSWTAFAAAAAALGCFLYSPALQPNASRLSGVVVALLVVSLLQRLGLVVLAKLLGFLRRGHRPRAR